MDEVKQIIVIRKDLNMRKGKMLAQGAHASMKVLLDQLTVTPISLSGGYIIENPRFMELSIVLGTSSSLYRWLSGEFTKIVVSVNSLEELEQLETQANNVGIKTAKITDAGRTEFGGVATVTALAIGPEKSNKIDPITKHLKLL